MQTSDIAAVSRILKREFSKHQAPVVDLIKTQTSDPFRILVATVLSARTKDQTTSDACKRLFPVVGNLDELKKISRNRLEKLIYPVGFYRMKAQHLKEMPGVLDKLYNGIIPDTVEELCELPGVGRKTANLVVAVAFEKPAICVDIHVHRISNRLGLVDTKTPLDTEMSLREIMPRRYWIKWNANLVSHGQRICQPRKPRCGECAIKKYCSQVGVQLN